MNFKSPFWIAVSLSVMFSCEEQNENNYKIFYHDFEPDILITSIRDSGYAEWYEAEDGPCFYPIPWDSSTNYKIDLNNDSILDFELIHFHHFSSTGSPHWFCSCFTYFSEISGIDTNNSIITSDLNSGYLIKLFKIGDTIFSDSQTKKYAFIYLDMNFAGAYFPCNGIYLIGVKTMKNEQNYIGWIQIDVNRDRLIIKDLAYINDENQFIIAGQIE